MILQFIQFNDFNYKITFTSIIKVSFIMFIKRKVYDRTRPYKFNDNTRLVSYNKILSEHKTRISVSVY